MSDYTLIWLFGGTFGSIGVLGGWMVVLKIQMDRLQTAQGFMINMLGKRAAFLLHSPHTPEFDALIDKFRRDNITDTEMQEFCDMLVKIESDPTMDKAERFLATVVLRAIEKIDTSTPKKFNVGDAVARREKEQDQAKPL